LARLDEVAAAHARFSTPSLRVELIAEFVTSPHATPYGVAGLLTCQPAFAAEVAGRLKGLVAELVERLRPARMLVGEVVDKPGQFFVLGDSSYPVDLDRYLQSSLHRQHLVALESRRVAASPARVAWRELDRAPAPRRAHLLAPLDPPEVWGGGITYRRSMQYYEAHTDEGGRTKGIYDHVYESERPELFFKATASRT